MSNRDYASIPCRIIEERPLSLRVEQAGSEFWLPRSQVKCISRHEDHPKGGRRATIEMPWWLAEEKGLEENPRNP
jgi:hypothetical protein